MIITMFGRFCFGTGRFFASLPLGVIATAAQRSPASKAAPATRRLPVGAVIAATVVAPFPRRLKPPSGR
jgi:hypothetical protein